MLHLVCELSSLERKCTEANEARKCSFCFIVNCCWAPYQPNAGVAHEKSISSAMYLRVNIKGRETRWMVMNKMSKNDCWSNVSWMVIRKDEHVRDLENGFLGLRRDLCISRDSDGNVLHIWSSRWCQVSR